MSIYPFRGLKGGLWPSTLVPVLPWLFFSLAAAGVTHGMLLASRAAASPVVPGGCQPLPPKRVPGVTRTRERLPRNTELTLPPIPRNTNLDTLMQQGLLIANANRTGTFR